MIFALYAQSKVSGTFQKYLQVRSQRGYTGYEVAKSIRMQAGFNISLERSRACFPTTSIPGTTSSDFRGGLFGNPVASLAVAAHETGHALQHKEQLLSAGVQERDNPVAQVGSFLAIPLFILAAVPLRRTLLMDIGIWLFAGSVAFTVITPVEFNASKRALRMLEAGGYLTTDEVPQAKQVLTPRH